MGSWVEQALVLSEACSISPGFPHPSFLPVNESGLENKVPGHDSSKILFSVHKRNSLSELVWEEVSPRGVSMGGWLQGVALSGVSKGRLPLPGLGLAQGDAWLCRSPPQCSLCSSEGVQGRFLHPCLLEPVGMGFPLAQAMIQDTGEGLGLLHSSTVD